MTALSFSEPQQRQLLQPPVRRFRAGARPLRHSIPDVVFVETWHGELFRSKNRVR